MGHYGANMRHYGILWGTVEHLWGKESTYGALWGTYGGQRTLTGHLWGTVVHL